MSLPIARPDSWTSAWWTGGKQRRRRIEGWCWQRRRRRRCGIGLLELYYVKDKKGGRGCSQVKVRVDQIIETLQEDDINSKSSEEARSSGSHPMDGVCPACPAIPVFNVSLSVIRKWKKERRKGTYQNKPIVKAIPPTTAGNNRHSGTGTSLLALSFRL